MAKKKEHSPYVVDQAGSWWFWIAIVPALVLGVSFRLFFSEKMVSGELRRAFSKLEPEVKIQFSGARLSLDEGWLWPKIAVVVSDISGFYVPIGRALDPIEVQLDELRAPIRLSELLSGQLSLSEIELGHMNLKFSVAPWKFVLPNQVKLPQLAQGLPVADPLESVSFKGNEEPDFQTSGPRPVDQVRMRSLRIQGPWVRNLAVEMRQLRLTLDRAGRAEMLAELFFPADIWGGSPNLPIFLRWDPEDKFISLNVSGRWREGSVSVSGTFDLTQDFFNIEALGRYLPSQRVFGFVQRLQEAEVAPWLRFPVRPAQGREFSEGWVSFESTALGYLISNKQSQISFRNILFEDRDQRWEVPLLSGVSQGGDYLWSSFDMILSKLSIAELDQVLPNLPAQLGLAQGVLSGVTQIENSKEIKFEWSIDQGVLQMQKLPQLQFARAQLLGGRDKKNQVSWSLETASLTAQSEGQKMSLKDSQASYEQLIGGGTWSLTGRDAQSEGFSSAEVTLEANQKKDQQEWKGIYKEWKPQKDPWSSWLKQANSTGLLNLVKSIKGWTELHVQSQGAERDIKAQLKSTNPNLHIQFSGELTDVGPDPVWSGSWQSRGQVRSREKGNLILWPHLFGISP